MNNPRSFDFLGAVAIVKFPRGTAKTEKTKFAFNLMKENKSIKSVLEKTDKFKGRLRKQETRYLAGEKTKEILYRENDCVFRFNIDNTYFSPRLSNERKEVALEIKKHSKKNDKILIMFSGVSPYSIVIAKNCKNCEIYSIELNRAATKYAFLNKDLNGVRNMEVIQGDVKKVIPKLIMNGMKFDFIVMPRPQLKDSFLKQAFDVAKHGTRIYYYDFCNEEDLQRIIKMVEDEAAKEGKRIKILNVKKAGEIGPYKLRVRVDFVVI
ncbi:MAG: methyltransferase domain-containing protein [Nanoarchaeota archaeon]